MLQRICSLCLMRIGIFLLTCLLTCAFVLIPLTPRANQDRNRITC